MEDVQFLRQNGGRAISHSDVFTAQIRHDTITIYVLIENFRQEDQKCAKHNI